MAAVRGPVLEVATCFRCDRPDGTDACAETACLGGLGLADNVLSKAIWTTMLANAFDMNVSTLGSLLPRLSHHRNGLSTQPPSVLGTLPS